MKSITIHNLEEPLLALLRDKAHREGRSINQTAKGILENAVGMRASSSSTHRSDFEEFSGAWSKEDLCEFEKATADLGKVDPREWE